MALFGSDIEKKVKAAAADGEPQWDGAGLKPGLQIWRIEQFKVKQWAKSKYGQFHKGDSYIILNTYVKDPAVNPDKLAWDIHFWIGRESTQDEYGTAAYKTVELDDKLGGEPVQHREVQEAESALFLGYFKSGLTYLSGGVESGFRHVEADEREVRLLQVKGRAGNILLTEVTLSRSYMNSGDVFILDSEAAIVQWNGNSANAHEKTHAASFCQSMKTERGGKPKLITLNEGVDDEDKPGEPAKEFLWKHLPGERKFLGIKYADITIKTAERGGDDDNVAAFVPTLYLLKPSGGLKRVWRQKSKPPPISKLQGGGIYLLDTGFEIDLWIGKKASTSLKASAFPFAQQYLKRYRRPPILPVHRYNEGHEPSEFKKHFGPAEEPGCCGCFG